MENIILIGHGSPKNEANNINLIGNLLHTTIHPGCNRGCVKVAYLQFAEPDIMETIKECAESGARKIIVHPFFLSSGMHVTKDIPEMIDEAKKLYPSIDFFYTEPLGIHEKLIDVVIERIKASGFDVPEDIEKRSFEIIGDEIDLSDIPAEHVPVVKRVIHATADFEFKDSLVFHPEAIKAGLEAIKAGKDILTDIEMVRTGINKRLLEKWGGKVICKIQNSEYKPIDTKHRTKTRAEMGIEAAFQENDNIGIVAIGNAPTALLKTIEIFNKSIVNRQSSLVIGVPVGFVKALESKIMLSAQKFPFITNLSRKGGTPVAVAIVNALLKMTEEI